MPLSLIQKLLQERNLDGWLLFDFHHANSLFWRLLSIDPSLHITRRVFYYIPQKGSCIKIVHKVEPHVLNSLEGEVRVYASIEELYKELSRLKGRVCMEYSKEIPYLSKVDGGTIDMLRDMGFEITSSADLLPSLTATLSKKQIESHQEAAGFLDKTVQRAFKKVQTAVYSGKQIYEADVRDFILESFEKGNFITEDRPIIARGENSANPHYSLEGRGDLIRQGDFLLIDLWCKGRGDEDVYADITRVGILGEPTDQMKKAFYAVRGAQELAVSFLKAKKQVTGAEIDTLCRNFLIEQGFKENIYHRTGHSIGPELHFIGANLDSLEANDHRILIPNTCYSVEPAVYLPGEFGLRLEHDIVVLEDDVLVTGGVQDKILQLWHC